jgi:acyl-ACP thioesterase
VTASGRLRLDAVARYLQDVAGDDVDDAGITGPWVVRRLTLRVERLPRFGEPVALVTFCSGTGAAWAERRTTLTVGGEVAVESVALWVYVRPDTARPAPLEAWFYGLYGEAAAGRKVSGRLRLPGPPTGAPPPRRWPLRVSDVDVLGHVNNAAHWEAVEEELARCAPGGQVVVAELEHRAAVDPGEWVDLVTTAGDAALSVWLNVRGEVCTAARVVLSEDRRR